MATKSKSKTRREIYRDILMKEGIKYEDCRILAFSFRAPATPETFHLRMMMDPASPVYHLFDCWDDISQIIIPDDDGTGATVRRIASDSGGKEIKPLLFAL